jgi:hypothetical protein
MLSLGLITLGKKVGDPSPPPATGGASGGGGGRAPGTFAPVKRKNPEPAENPRPFRIVLRQRVNTVNYAEVGGCTAVELSSVP